MDDARLSVEIGAKLTELNAAMAQAVNTVEAGGAAMAASVDRTEKSFQLLNNTKFTFGANYAKQSAAVGSATEQLAKQASAGAAVLGGSVVKGSNQAAFALTNLGRVAQDAPFGFIGIQNNLNPLLESFQRLKAETGSSSLALKALGSSLMGPAGVGLALSLITSALVLYTQWQQKSKKATEDAGDANEKYIKSLDQVTQAQLLGAQNAQKEIEELKTLYSITQNTTLSMQKRKQAVDELQSKYPAYFKNIDDEAILTGKAKDAYDRLAESIIATAKARAAQDLIVSNSKTQLINEQKITDLTVERDKQSAISARTLKSLAEGGAQAGQSAAGFADIAAKAERRAADIQKEINALKLANNDIDKKNLDLTKNINQEVAAGADLTGNNTDKIKDTSKELASLQKQLKEAKEDARQFFETAKGDIDFASPVKDLKKQFDDSIKHLQDKNNTSVTKLDIPVQFKIPDGVGGLFDDYEAISKQVASQNETLANSFTNAFTDIGAAIGGALANGTSLLDAFGQSVLSSIGDVLVQFGKMTIAAGVASTALSTLFKNPLAVGSGFGAIAAGVALVAIGSAAKGFSSKVGSKGGATPNTGGTARPVRGYAAGGTNIPAGDYLVGEVGPEILQVPRGSNVIPNHRIGRSGNGQQVFIADTVIRGTDLVISYNRQSSLNKRTG